MRGELVKVVDDAAAVVELTELEERARSFTQDSRSSSTWRAYESDEPAKTMAANIIRTRTEEINKMAELLKSIQ